MTWHFERANHTLMMWLRGTQHLLSTWGHEFFFARLLHKLHQSIVVFNGTFNNISKTKTCHKRVQYTYQACRDLYLQMWLFRKYWRLWKRNLLTQFLLLIHVGMLKHARTSWYETVVWTTSLNWVTVLIPLFQLKLIRMLWYISFWYIKEFYTFNVGFAKFYHFFNCSYRASEDFTWPFPA